MDWWEISVWTWGDLYSNPSSAIGSSVALVKFFVLSEFQCPYLLILEQMYTNSSQVLYLPHSSYLTNGIMITEAAMLFLFEVPVHHLQGPSKQPAWDKAGFSRGD